MIPVEFFFYGVYVIFGLLILGLIFKAFSAPGSPFKDVPDQVGNAIIWVIRLLLDCMMALGRLFMIMLHAGLRLIRAYPLPSMIVILIGFVTLLITVIVIRL